MIALLMRDLRLATRAGGGFGLGLAFFLIVCTLVPFGVGPEGGTLALIAPGILWVGALLACLLSLDRIFALDWEDGSLDLLATAQGARDLREAGDQRGRLTAEAVAEGAPPVLWGGRRPQSESSRRARSRITSRSPRRHAPAGSGLIRESRCSGWLDIARRAKRSRSSTLSTRDCAAVARRTKRHRAASQKAPTMRIGVSAVTQPRVVARLSTALTRSRPASSIVVPAPAASRKGVATLSSSTGRSSTVLPAVVSLSRNPDPADSSRWPGSASSRVELCTARPTRAQRKTQAIMRRSATT